MVPVASTAVSMPVVIMTHLTCRRPVYHITCDHGEVCSTGDECLTRLEEESRDPLMPPSSLPSKISTSPSEEVFICFSANGGSVWNAQELSRLSDERTPCDGCSVPAHTCPDEVRAATQLLLPVSNVCLTCSEQTQHAFVMALAVALSSSRAFSPDLA